MLISAAIASSVPRLLMPLPSNDVPDKSSIKVKTMTATASSIGKVMALLRRNGHRRCVLRVMATMTMNRATNTLFVCVLLVGLVENGRRNERETKAR